MEIVAQVVDGGKTGMVATMFGMPDTSRDYELIHNLVAPEKLYNVTQSFHNSMSMLNDAYRGEETMRVARQVIAHHGSLFNPNVLTYLNSNNITKPNQMMRNIIYSHPEVYRLDSLGVIQGFDDAIADIDLHHYVNEGVIQSKGDLGVYNEYYDTEYSEIYTEDDRDIIRHAWSLVDNLLENSIDPTDEELRPF